MSKMEPENNLADREQVEVYSPPSGEYIVLILRGKMVYENASAIGKILESKLQEKCSYVVDVDALERLDSTGFGVLMTFAKKVAKQDGQVGYKVSNEFLKELFEIAKFNYVFPMAETHEEVWQLMREGFQPKIPLTQY